MTKIHVFGFPGFVGGANTELWHTLALWRKYDCRITITPTWKGDPTWAAKCESIGCEVQTGSASTIRPEPGVPLISFCNPQFFNVLRRIDPRMSPTIWVPCMNFLTDRERRRYSALFCPSVIVCQSHFQKSQIQPDLAKFGIRPDRVVRIRGAFDPDSIAYAPKPRGEEFVIGRISRADPQKFPYDIWQTLYRVRCRINRPMKVKVLGWRPGLAKRVGPPPSWAEVFEPGSVGAIDFLRSVDVLWQSGETAENWPRVGLEAMAAGVPLVADRKGGWIEMTDGGDLAALASTSAEAEEILVRMADASPAEIAAQTELSRRAIDEWLGSTKSLWDQWSELFMEVTREP